MQCGPLGRQRRLRLFDGLFPRLELVARLVQLPLRLLNLRVEFGNFAPPLFECVLAGEQLGLLRRALGGMGVDQFLALPLFPVLMVQLGRAFVERLLTRFEFPLPLVERLGAIAVGGERLCAFRLPDLAFPVPLQTSLFQLGPQLLDVVERLLCLARRPTV